MTKKKHNSTTPKWKTFEESAKNASTKIFKNEIVLANQKVKGSISEVLRQIDIKVGEDDFIDIECKNHHKPVDLPIVEQFVTKLEDENAKQGMLISNSGFTEAALKMAKKKGIKAAVLIDNGFDGVSNFAISAPVKAVAYYVDGISYEVSQSSGQYFEFSPLIWDMKAVEGLGAPRNLYEVFRDNWNDGKLNPAEIGGHEYAFKGVQIYDLRGEAITVDLTYKYVIAEDLRQGRSKAKTAQGFYDVNKGEFTTVEKVEFEPINLDKISEWPNANEKSLQRQNLLSIEGIVPLPDNPPLESYRNGFTGKMLTQKTLLTESI